MEDLCVFAPLGATVRPVWIKAFASRHMLCSPTSSPPLARSLARSPCEHVCTDPTAASTQTGEAPCAPTKAVSGNFTLSHACSHVGLPRANSLPVSAAEQRTRTHLLETLALNKLRRWGVDGGGGGRRGRICRTKRGGERRQ